MRIRLLSVVLAFAFLSTGAAFADPMSFFHSYSTDPTHPLDLTFQLPTTGIPAAFGSIDQDIYFRYNNVTMNLNGVVGVYDIEFIPIDGDGGIELRLADNSVYARIGNGLGDENYFTQSGNQVTFLNGLYCGPAQDDGCVGQTAFTTIAPVVPEPPSLVLLTTGAVGLLIAARRTRGSRPSCGSACRVVGVG